MMNNSILSIAKKELNDGLRNRWLLFITLLFSIMAIGISWFGAAASGHVGFTNLPATIASLASLATFIVPLISLLLAYDAIIGEEENGTLILLLTYPISKVDIILGKFLGHGIILSLATLIGFGSAAVAIALLVPDVDNFYLVLSFSKFILSSILLGLVFLSFAYVLSCHAKEKSTAIGLALGLWFLFVLAFDLVLLALLVMSEGSFNPDALPWLLLLNPTDVYRLINLMGLDMTGAGTGVMSLASDLPVSAGVLWFVLGSWVVMALLLAKSLFMRKDF